MAHHFCLQEVSVALVSIFKGSSLSMRKNQKLPRDTIKINRSNRFIYGMISQFGYLLTEMGEVPT